MIMSLEDHSGSNDGQTFPVSHAWLSREPGQLRIQKRSRHLTKSLSNLDLFPETLSAVAEETEDSLCVEVASDETQGSEKAQPPHDRGFRALPPYPLPHNAFDAFGLGGGTRGGRGQQLREQQRRGDVIRRSRSCLAATRTRTDNTNFGQTKFGKHQLWPNQVWPKPTFCFQDRGGGFQGSGPVRVGAGPGRASPGGPRSGWGPGEGGDP